MEAELRLEFANLPLIEVAARLTFEQPLKLTFGLINDLGEKLRPAYPILTELEGFEQPPGVNVPLSLEIHKLPGAAYAGAENGITLTLQDRMIAARWRNQAASDAPAYPRFAAVETALFDAYQHLRGMHKNQVPVVAVVNMVYVNLIYPNNPRTIVQDYFAEKVQVEILKPASAVHELMFSWREESSVDLRMHLQSVTAQIGEQARNGFRLATAGGRKLGAGDDARKALESIHRRLQYFFRDLLSARAQGEWGMKGA